METSTSLSNLNLWTKYKSKIVDAKYIFIIVFNFIIFDIFPSRIFHSESNGQSSEIQKPLIVVTFKNTFAKKLRKNIFQAATSISGYPVQEKINELTLNVILNIKYKQIISKSL